MTTSKLFINIALFVISCSIHVVAQTEYYYYKGKKIPLKINESLVCVSIPKDNKYTSVRLLSNIKVHKKINDNIFDIFAIYSSDFEKISSLESWNINARNIITTPTYITTNNVEVFATPYLNIRLKRKEDIDILISYAQQYGLDIIKQDPLMPLWYILAITPNCNRTILECANKLWETGLFAASLPDLSSAHFACSNDPLFNQQWGLQNNDYTGIDINVEPAWNYATGKNIKIAILDSGVDLNHIDLASNISDLSYDTETNTSPSIVYSDHGTHCAGIAAAVKDNGIQIAGVAPDATIVSISHTMETSTNDGLKFADGIVWAYQHGVDIISNSWYFPEVHSAIDEAIHDAFKYGRNGKGCVIVFVSGNFGEENYENCISYPAICNDTILAVGAISRTGARTLESDYGFGLDLVAPGEDILSTIPNNATEYKSGTSMACPHVAGVAALVLERNSELTVSQVNSIINGNAKKIQGVNFNILKPDGSWNNEIGYGLIDAYGSVINTPNDAYIQNDTITGTRVISAENIYVGRDVTNTKQYGDVILGLGNIMLKAQYVKIKNSTTVPLGTTLTIEN